MRTRGYELLELGKLPTYILLVDRMDAIETGRETEVEAKLYTRTVDLRMIAMITDPFLSILEVLTGSTVDLDDLLPLEAIKPRGDRALTPVEGPFSLATISRSLLRRALLVGYQGRSAPPQPGKKEVHIPGLNQDPPPRSSSEDTNPPADSPDPLRSRNPDSDAAEC